MERRFVARPHAEAQDHSRSVMPSGETCACFNAYVRHLSARANDAEVAGLLCDAPPPLPLVREDRTT